VQGGADNGRPTGHLRLPSFPPSLRAVLRDRPPIQSDHARSDAYWVHDSTVDPVGGCRPSTLTAALGPTLFKVSGPNKQLAEEWFEDYLRERGLDGGDDQHPDLGGGLKAPRPDYRISGGTEGAICEVKGFTNSKANRRMAEATGAVTLSGGDVYGSVRNTIAKAAKRQLRPYRHREEALIVVLANPRGVYVPLEQADDVIAAMYGNLGVAVPLDGSSDGQTIFMEDGVFGGGRHRYVSAVVTLHRREKAAAATDDWRKRNEHKWVGIEGREQRMAMFLEARRDPSYLEAEQTSGAYHFTRVYSTTSTATGDAVPVPRNLFDGPHDEFWAMNSATGCLELVTPRIPGRVDS